MKTELWIHLGLKRKPNYDEYRLRLIRKPKYPLRVKLGPNYRLRLKRKPNYEYRLRFTRKPKFCLRFRRGGSLLDRLDDFVFCPFQAGECEQVGGDSIPVYGVTWCHNENVLASRRLVQLEA